MEYFVRTALALLEARFSSLKPHELKSIMGHHGFKYDGRNKEHAFTHHETGKSFAVSDQPEYGPGLMPKIAKDAARAADDRDLGHRDNWDPLRLKSKKPREKAYHAPKKPKNELLGFPNMPHQGGRKPGRPKDLPPLSKAEREQKIKERGVLRTQHQSMKAKMPLTSGTPSYKHNKRGHLNVLKKAEKITAQLRGRD